MSAAPGVVVVDRRIEREGLSKQLLSFPLVWLLPAVAKQALLGLIITQGAARAASEILKQLNTCSRLRAPGSAHYRSQFHDGDEIFGNTTDMRYLPVSPVENNYN